MDRAFRAPRLIGEQGETSGWVGVRNGRIVAVEPFDRPLEADEVIELGTDEVLLPGLVDTHVHVNDPGRSEWEGFETATRAAAEGGITTIVDMPLNSLPPTVDAEALEVKRKTAREKVHVDVGFWGGAISGNLDSLRELHDDGVFGFKCFLLHSGVDEFPPLDPAELEKALSVLTGFGAMMIVHAEDSDSIEHAPVAHGEEYGRFLASRPRGAENLAIAQVIELARRYDARVHILHLSSSDALPMIASAKADGVRITVETCPHYLCFTAEEIPDGATPYKCCPPIREAGNRERLWQGLADGTIDCIVSDHSPCTAELKKMDIGDFGVAWGGVSSLQLGLSAVWTQARLRGYALTDVVDWMAHRTADLAGLRQKGAIEVGRDADLCVFAPDDAYVVDAARLRHRNPVSAYDGRALAGVVRGTWLRGERIVGPDIDSPGQRGQLLDRDAVR
ncbi:allantoinase AllB [Allosaccharopolyspora coralli]|uniref:allantoinase n=1 Tax=Allosaccharopolyspora coralli TaxID=2665642 RepID=A0A5Q3QCE0_9PSEU|nr:allantoinase AllB [Allosaccharopolyspora coralli]QGK72228.1 allantoinase AllB [Allosaccharopolyspora coralli]